MPAALTLEQKRERALAQQASNATNSTKSSSRRRSAFNGTEGKMKIANSDIPGFHLYIFNDTPGRIDQAINSGWEFVAPEEVGGTSTNVVSRNTDIGGDKVRFLVGRDEAGGPLYAYLMKIKQEWWDEDQAAIQERNNMVDMAVKTGRTPGVDASGFYSPKGGISITN